MATSTQKVLRLTFQNTSGSATSITLPEPKENLPAADIQTAMDLVISKNIFATTGGDLTAKRDIRIIDTTTDDLYDAPTA
ncbi:MAG: hypothetical protein AWM53_01906 [Candidatus Dichloromethanomonas elyunquensis]|nr:MAG: hypothetical protein AWM53_01906 [Candidatus Dichloromethanomonas elyunquensis]